MATQTTEPPAARAGDTLSFTKTLADYPASAGWVLSYALLKSGTRITFTASASGDDHAVSVAASTTASWAAGRYRLVGRVAKAGEAYTVVDTSLDVLPDLAAASTGYDARTHAQKTLDALEAWIENHDSAVAEYEIAGRRMKYIPVAELIKLRAAYQNEVAAETAAAGLAAGIKPKRRLLVRFNQ